jgi:hypothetical protein
MGTAVDVAANILFSDTSEEGNQGQVGDCYFLAPFNSLNTADWFRKLLVTRNAGGVDVIFRRDLNNPVIVRHFNNLIGAAFTRPDPVTGACALCLAERAFAYFRTKANTYASLNWGWPGNVYSDFGCANAFYSMNQVVMLTAVTTALTASRGVSLCTFATIPSGIPMIGSHCYSVIKTYMDAAGVLQWQLRNPWGFDGAGADPNPYDGVVTLTNTQMLTVVSGLAVQTAFPIAIPSPIPVPPPVQVWIPGDANKDGKVDFNDYIIFSQNYGKAGGWAQGDFNGDGLVDFKDFLILSQHYGEHN